MKLYKHQQDIVDADPKWTGLFLGTGSGKTRTALELAQGNTMVIAPKTQFEDKNWQREHMKMDGRGPKSLFVISKETFRRDWQSLPRFDTVIVDEAHTCLGVTPNTRQRKKQIIPKASQLYEALDSYVAYNKPDRLYLVTATIMRSPMTVWAAAKVLGKTWDFYEFRQTFYVKLPMPGRDVWQAKRDNESKDRLAKAVRSLGYIGRLEDFFDVPEQTHKVEKVQLTDAQRDRIKDLRLEYPEPIVRVGKIHQVENGVLAGDEFSMGQAFANAKMDKIVDYSWEFPRMVVFAKYRAQIEDMRMELERIGKKVLVLNGDTVDRGSLIADANASDECVFIAQAQISAGWELPDYPVMIFSSKTYSFVDYDQAVGRIHRANKLKKNLYIHLIVEGGVDEAVHDSVENKKDFNERIYLNI